MGIILLYKHLISKKKSFLELIQLFLYLCHQYMNFLANLI